jgi:hypothetical protein
MNDELHEASSGAAQEADLREALELHHAMSYGWALSCCSSNPNDAEDILQTVYQKILEGRARYDGRAAFKTWLFAVIRNTAASERRRNWIQFLRLENFVRNSLPNPAQKCAVTPLKARSASSSSAPLWPSFPAARRRFSTSSSTRTSPSRHPRKPWAFSWVGPHPLRPGQKATRSLAEIHRTIP